MSKHRFRTARVFLNDGSNYATSVNGTNTEIQNYFQIGKVLNMGVVADRLVKIESLTIEN